MDEKPETISEAKEAAELALLKAIRVTASRAASDVAIADSGVQWADAALRLGEALESIHTWAS